MRFLLAIFLFVYAMLLQAAPIPESKFDDGPDAMNSNGRNLANAWLLGRIDDVDDTLRVWWDDRRRFKDGRFEIFAYQIDMASWFSGSDDLGDADAWKQYRSIVEMQQRDYPRSIANTLAAAQFWHAWAWNARGTGYTDEVAPESRKLYEERLEKSRQILEAAKPFAAANPLWYYQMLNIATEQSWDEDKYAALFKEATRRYPDFIFFYFANTTHLTPKWGGSAERFDAFVQQTVDATRATEGEGMYARLYWSYSDQQVRGNLFDTTPADWSRMKQGFQDLLKRYPKSSWLINNFASFACRARDRPTFEELAVRIGHVAITQAWPSGYSFATCKATLVESP